MTASNIHIGVSREDTSLLKQSARNRNKERTTHASVDICPGEHWTATAGATAGEQSKVNDPTDRSLDDP
jgi:hypothetical protein